MVLVHAGVVYESSGIMGPYWVVDDPSTSDLPGLLNLILDLFVMPTMFFVSGFLAKASLERRGRRGFLISRVRRPGVPWVVALFTLIPLYNALYLYARGLPQGGWSHYFHFSNETIGMSWLWFLPVLLAFDALYALLDRLGPRLRGLTPARAVIAVFALNVGSCWALGRLGRLGWTKTPLVDFQNERLIPYFLVFLLGSFFRSSGAMASGRPRRSLYAAVCSTAWIPINVYLIVLINFFLRPGQPIVSSRIDELALWICLHLSILALLYCSVATFERRFRRQGRMGRALADASYGVYIVHVVVPGAIATVLLDTDLPVLVKYSMLTLGTYGASNALVVAWRAARRLAGNPPCGIGVAVRSVDGQ